MMIVEFELTLSDSVYICIVHSETERIFVYYLFDIHADLSKFYVFQFGNTVVLEETVESMTS